MKVDFTLNGEGVSAEAAPGTRLVDLLRESFGMLRTKVGCYAGACGTCIVILNDLLVHSCLLPAFAVKGNRVTTFEGVSSTLTYREIAAAFDETGSTPCSTCFQGKTLSLYQLFETVTAPTKAEIDSVILAHRCRCTDYPELAEVVRNVVVRRRKRQRAELI